MLGTRGHMLREKILFRLYFEKLIYFYIKHNYYSYLFVMRLFIAPGIFWGKTCQN